LIVGVIGKLLDNAVDKRDAILDGGTSAVRLVDGAGDGVPGFSLESYAGKWMAMTPGSEIAGEVKDWLKAGGKSVYWKRLDKHQKESPVHLYGEAVDAPFLVRENGLVFEVSFSA
jgi:23S rRNA (cytosine1962-C5)-methyltransferase